MKPQTEPRPPGAAPARFQPSQWSVFGFRFVPLLLFAVGTCGADLWRVFHRIPVTETREEEVLAAVPVKPPVPPGVGPGECRQALVGRAGPVFPPAWDAGPPVKFITQIKTVKTTTDELEAAVNRAVTSAASPGPTPARLEPIRGGGGKGGPSFCPT